MKTLKYISKAINLNVSKFKLECYKSRNCYFSKSDKTFVDCDEITQLNFIRLSNNINFIILKGLKIKQLDIQLRRNCIKTISRILYNKYNINNSSFVNIINDKYYNEYNAYLLYISNCLFIFINHNSLE